MVKAVDQHVVFHRFARTEPFKNLQRRHEIAPSIAINCFIGRSFEVPHDRAGSFGPLLIAKHERRFTGFHGRMIAIYARA